MERLTPEDFLVLGTGLFAFIVACGVALLWRASAQLRDALTGQDGYRLMVIFTRLIAVGAVSLFSTALRSLMFMLQGDFWDYARAALAIATFLLVVAVDSWALLALRDIARSGNHHITLDDK